MAEHPRILFIADLNVYSKGLGRARILQQFPFPSFTYSHTAIGGESQGHPSFSLAYRFAYKLGKVLDTEDINRILVHEAAARQPDLIWIEKGVMVRPETLLQVRRKAPAVRLASYSEDDMALSHNRSIDFTAGLSLYDTIFTTKNANMAPGELTALGAKRVVLVDKAFDPHQHHPVDVGRSETIALGGDVGFIGTFEAERAASLAFLAENGIRVRVWGNGWEEWVGRHRNLMVENKAVVNTEADLTYSKAICATRINLAFLRKLNRDHQTDRSVEIPACGGFMLAERSEDHRRLFEEDREAAYFGSNEELLEKIRYYLDHEDERAAIAKAGHERCQKSRYDETARFHFMLKTALDEPLPMPL